MNPWDGRELLSQTDLVLPGLMNIVIQRSYDSQAEYDSALGYGWSLTYFMRLYEFTDGSVTLRRDCGARRSFVLAAGSYQTPVGESGTLIKNGDGSWTYWEKSGERKEFDNQGLLVGIFSPQGPGLVFTYDARGKLPLIGLSPYAVDPATPLETAQEHRLIQIEEWDGMGQATGRWVSFTYDEGSGRLTGLADSAGRTVQYVHDGVGNLVQVVTPLGDALSFSYEDPNDVHNVSVITSSPCVSCVGPLFYNSYDSEDRVIRQEHGDHVMTFHYDIPYAQTTFIEETYDDQGVLLHTATWVYEFNEYGNPTVTTDPLGNQTVNFYDSRMNVVRTEVWEDQGGPSLVLLYAEEKTYDAQSNLLTYTEAVGFSEERTTSYVYDSYGRLTSIRVPSVVDAMQNRVTSYTYDANDNVLTRTEQGLLGNGTPFSYVTTYAYNGNGQILSVDGPRTSVSDVTSYTYDPIGNLSSVTLPENLTTSYSMYIATGRPQTVTDPNGVTTNYTYDALGKTLSTTIGGDTTSNSYSPNGSLEMTTLPRLNGVSYSYDSLERLSTLADGIGSTIGYTYDSVGNRIQEEYKDSVGAVRKTTSFEYDPLHRLEKIRFSDGTFWQYGYDARGNRVSEKDPNNNPATVTEYDSLGRVERLIQKVTSPSQGLHDVITQYQYDRHDNLTGLIDANGLQTTYVYDDMGRVFQEISPDTGITTFLYDEAGNVISKTDARGIQVTYAYDGLNRVTLTNFPTDEDITYVYDNHMGCTNGKGRLCFVDDQPGTVEYSYTAKGELAQEVRFVDAVAQAFTTGYSYDANGNLDILAYPSGRTVDYDYDLADQILTVTTTPFGGSQQAVASNVQYEPFGPLKKLTHGNNLIRDVGFDDRYRVRSIKTADSVLSNVIQDLVYTPDANGNILSISDNADPTKSTTFGYDEFSRLTSALGPYASAGGSGTLAWTYDDVGNRLTYEAPEGLTTYAHFPNTNRLQNTSGAAVQSFGYDAAGNTEILGTRLLTYDDDGRLRNATLAGSSVDMEYDSDKLRITRVSGADLVVFIYDVRLNLIAETDALGQATVEYVYVGDEMIATLTESHIAHVHSDHFASPRAITDGALSSVSRLSLRPFGDVASWDGTDELAFRFLGHYADPETELHQNHWRDYAPSLGRYLEADPLGIFDGPNRYVYAKNDPIRIVDPSGLCAVPSRYLDCLLLVFPDEPVGDVKLSHKPNPNRAKAWTWNNTINIQSRTCDEFWADTLTVLEEYYHVLEQWKKKKFFAVRYGAKWFGNLVLPNKHRYFDNGYEKEAKSFAISKQDDFEQCLDKCQ